MFNLTISASSHSDDSDAAYFKGLLIEPEAERDVNWVEYDRDNFK